MERLTMCIDGHLLDNGKLDKEYSLTDKMEFNEFSCIDLGYVLPGLIDLWEESEVD